MSTPPSLTEKSTSPSALLRRVGLLLPFPLRRKLKTLLDRHDVPAPPVGQVDFGDFRRTAPFCANYGYSRGSPVDRYYIERFLERHAADICGRVLEVGDDAYTRRFGGSRVTGAISCMWRRFTPTSLL